MKKFSFLVLISIFGLNSMERSVNWGKQEETSSAINILDLPGDMANEIFGHLLKDFKNALKVAVELRNRLDTHERLKIAYKNLLRSFNELKKIVATNKKFAEIIFKEVEKTCENFFTANHIALLLGLNYKLIELMKNDIDLLSKDYWGNSILDLAISTDNLGFMSRVFTETLSGDNLSRNDDIIRRLFLKVKSVHMARLLATYQNLVINPIDVDFLRRALISRMADDIFQFYLARSSVGQTFSDYDMADLIFQALTHNPRRVDPILTHFNINYKTGSKFEKSDIKKITLAAIETKNLNLIQKVIDIFDVDLNSCPDYIDEAFYHGDQVVELLRRNGAQSTFSIVSNNCIIS